MAKLPKSIQKEIDEAEAFERELAEQAQPEEAVEPQALEEMPSEGDETPQEVPHIEPQDDKNWEHKYRVLQTKYDAEVPRLYGQVRELTESLDQLSQRLESSLQPSEIEAPSAFDNKSLDDLRKEFGDDFVDAMLKVAAAEAERQVKLQTAESKQRLTRLEGREQETTKERFYSQLEARVPNWNEINADQGWLSWLQEYDPIVGATRQAALDSAAGTMDAIRVAAIFDSYLLTRQHIQRAPVSSAPSRAMQEQIAPRGQGGSTGSVPTRKVYSEAETKELLSMHHMRRLSRDQQDALEREIEMAYHEGRVIAA